MINIIGLGYIGLPTALMFSTHDIKVVGTDLNSDLINKLNSGIISFEEPGMDELLKKAHSRGVIFTDKYQNTDVYIITVPTPYDTVSKRINPSYVVSAIESVLKVCTKRAIIIIESTVSPGTIDKYIRPIIVKHGLKQGVDIHLAHAPERIIPGNMVYELKHNSRTIGTDEPIIGEIIKDLYASFCKGEIVLTDIRTAEMTKVVENTYRDINIAYANELAMICHSDDLDVYEIIRIANKHPRVNILQPGPGVGGHCIPVDPWFLVGDYPSLTNITQAARKINNGIPQFVIHRNSQIMKKCCMSDVSRVGLYGLTYKENVNDTRESPTLQMLEQMENGLAGGLVQVYDPYVHDNLMPNQHYDLDDFLNSVDLVVIMVAHDQIKKNLWKLDGKIVLDTKNISGLDSAYKLYGKTE